MLPLLKGYTFIIPFFLLSPILYSCTSSSKTAKSVYIQKQGRTDKPWKLVWEDDFTGHALDTSRWSKVPPGSSDWDRHMSPDERCFSLSGGLLTLKGIINPDTTRDKRPFITGGIFSKGKFSFQYGKIEIRAKLGTVRGAWPAIWMLADSNRHGGYPRNGEIDIMEHLNFDSIVYQTVHSYYTLHLKQENNPPHYGTAKMKVDDFNIFGLKWYPDRLVFLLNGQETFTYPRRTDVDPSQWPFDAPMYLLIDQQLGGNWVGKVAPDQLPVEMVVDWVRLYQ